MQVRLAYRHRGECNQFCIHRLIMSVVCCAAWLWNCPDACTSAEPDGVLMKLIQSTTTSLLHTLLLAIVATVTIVQPHEAIAPAQAVYRPLDQD